jgi:Pyruvate/2-oxoacid:ferredoxin oxidoreductase delta subunit
MDLINDEVKVNSGGFFDADAVGFIYPIYFDRSPEIILKAIKKSHFSESQYIFAITTSGEATGNALHELDAVLKIRGGRLDYGKNVVMADNSIILQTSQEAADLRLKYTDNAADEIASAVTNHTHFDLSVQKSNSLAFMGKVNKFAVVHYYNAEDRQVNKELCTQCGTCINLCPAKNISMEEGKVKIGDHCEWCFACLNWCPKKAIKFGRIDPSKSHQYRCPGINASEIMNKTNTSFEIRNPPQKGAG